MHLYSLCHTRLDHKQPKMLTPLFFTYLRNNQLRNAYINAMNNLEIFTLCSTLCWAPKQPKMLIPATKYDPGLEQMFLTSKKLNFE